MRNTSVLAAAFLISASHYSPPDFALSPEPWASGTTSKGSGHRGGGLDVICADQQRKAIMNADELKKVLDSHRKWMNNDGGERANLTGAYLYGADLTEANLRGANLSCANLTEANLSCANLTEANLRGANLTGAYLYGANLTGANLTGANLYGADLTEANLRGANLSCANLRGANLTGAYLYGANLSCANLTGADLSCADLSGADLTEANLRGANLTDIKLTNAVGGNHRIQCLQIDPYKIIVLDNEIAWGGCTKKTVKEWLDYDGADRNADDRNYLETVTKPFIRMVCREKP